MRTHCMVTVMDMALKGVGVEHAVALVAEAGDDHAPQPLRLALIHGLREMLQEPKRRATFSGNKVVVTVPLKIRDAITTTLSRLSTDPDTRIAEAAKAALRKRQD